MHAAAVADAGGILVVAGLLEGAPPDVADTLALDATSLLLAEYLALRHEGSPSRARLEFALAIRVVSEWFPVRAIAIDAALAMDGDGTDVESVASLTLAESLSVPLVTKNRGIRSDGVPVLYC